MKSYVSDCLELMAGIYADATTRCSTDVSDVRDLMTIRSRVKARGLSFLTITLPAFCSDFEQALAAGMVSPHHFKGFRRWRGGALPAFLRGMLGRIFDQETGSLLDDKRPPTPVDGESGPDIPTLVDSVRQICRAFSKVELPCAPARERRALAKFIEVEYELEAFQAPETTETFRSVAAVLWGTVLRGFEAADVVPQHGPGATAERILGNQKYVWRSWYECLEPYLPFFGQAVPLGAAAWREVFENVTFVPVGQELPVRVVTVPKTLKAPRVIAIEPCCMQYAQQSVRDFLYRKIETSPLTSGSINFADQGPNQRAALLSSHYGTLATIDLSDASDRVPLKMVKLMLESCPELLDMILACRSERAQMPSGLVIAPLYKFASMGSALCFPVEAMYFYTVCVVALMDAYKLPLSSKTLRRVKEMIHVYGDDILVPVDQVEYVLDYLQKYNCKVNSAKSFWTGRFRESCGLDAYDGRVVTPTYIRRMRPEDARQAAELISAVDTRNQFYKKGFWRTASILQKWVEDQVGDLPYLPDGSGALGWYSYLGYHTVERWSVSYQRFEVKALVPSPILSTDEIGDYPALMRFFLGQGGPAVVDDRSGLAVKVARDNERSVRRGDVTLKRRWVWSPDHLVA